MSLSDWVRLARAEHGVITLVGVAVGWALCAAPSGRALAAGLGPMLITWAAFILNDYFDVASDRALNRRDRPLVSGAIRKIHAIYAAAILFGAGLALSAPFGRVAFAIALAFAVAAVAYNARLKRLPLVGNVYIAASMAVPFLYGAFASQAPVAPVVYVLAAMAFVTGVGRELFITTRDVVGDRKLGAKTLPMLIGAKATLRLGALLFAAAVALSAIPVVWGSAGLSYAVPVMVCDGLLISCAWLGANKPDVAGFKKIRNYSLAALGIGMLGFAALALKV